MPTIVRRPIATIVETRKEVFHATSWQVRSSVWNPPTDVYETEQNLIIKVEVAGMRDEDFEVAIEENILIILGIRPDQSERRAYHQMEIMYGKFEIAIQLPVNIDIDHALAEYKDGFLIITLPKMHRRLNEDG
jgi:HSP20 family protein